MPRRKCSGNTTFSSVDEARLIFERSFLLLLNWVGSKMYPEVGSSSVLGKTVAKYLSQETYHI